MSGVSKIFLLVNFLTNLGPKSGINEKLGQAVGDGLAALSAKSQEWLCSGQMNSEIKTHRGGGIVFGIIF